MHHTGYCSGWNSRKKTPSFAGAFLGCQSRLAGKAFPVKTYAQNNIFNLAISLIYFFIKTRRLINPVTVIVDFLYINSLIFQQKKCY
jgi:hypothetical protein